MHSPMLFGHFNTKKQEMEMAKKEKKIRRRKAADALGAKPASMVPPGPTGPIRADAPLVDLSGDGRTAPAPTPAVPVPRPAAAEPPLPAVAGEFFVLENHVGPLVNGVFRPDGWYSTHPAETGRDRRPPPQRQNYMPPVRGAFHGWDGQLKIWIIILIFICLGTAGAVSWCLSP